MFIEHNYIIVIPLLDIDPNLNDLLFLFSYNVTSSMTMAYYVIVEFICCTIIQCNRSKYLYSAPLQENWQTKNYFIIIQKNSKIKKNN